MRKLREAAVVTAMVGSAVMLGAGVAAAGGGGIPPVSVTCSNDSSSTSTGTSQTGDQNLEGGLSSGGDASTNANQNACGIGNDGNTNTSGDATGGAGGPGTIAVNEAGLIEAIVGILA